MPPCKTLPCQAQTGKTRHKQRLPSKCCTCTCFPRAKVLLHACRAAVPAKRRTSWGAVEGRGQSSGQGCHLLQASAGGTTGPAQPACLQLRNGAHQVRVPLSIVCCSCVSKCLPAIQQPSSWRRSAGTAAWAKECLVASRAWQQLLVTCGRSSGLPAADVLAVFLACPCRDLDHVEEDTADAVDAALATMPAAVDFALCFVANLPPQGNRSSDPLDTLLSTLSSRLPPGML